jgi:transcriptional regulator with XRE-family HTH domain
VTERVIDGAVLQRFGLSVRRHREVRSWSQERLAEVSNLNRSYIGELERGQATASLLTLVKLSLALGVTVGQLTEEAEHLAKSRSQLNLPLTSIAC